MKTLSKEQVLRLHNALLETFGGTAGIRDDGLLESALNAPFATFGGQYLYPSVQAKAAQLGFGLVCNHPSAQRQFFGCFHKTVCIGVEHIRFLGGAAAGWVDHGNAGLAVFFVQPI